jgi:hypothetical protein
MNTTQLVGILAFGSAAAFCFWARWGLIGAINAVFALECAMGLRHAIHDVAEQIIGQPYPGRSNIQIGFIVLAVLLFVGAIWLARRAKPGLCPQFVIAATMAALTLFCIEIISLGAVDAILYQTFGYLKVIAWLWIALATIVIAGASRAVIRPAR